MIRNIEIEDRLVVARKSEGGRREQEGRMDRDVEGWPEGQFWVCCVTLGELPNLSEPVSSSLKWGVKE